MSSSSGASNRQRQREADTARRAEQTHAPRRLGYLSPAQALEAREIMDQILSGVIVDPDDVPDDDEEDGE